MTGIVVSKMAPTEENPRFTARERDQLVGVNWISSWHSIPLPSHLLFFLAQENFNTPFLSGTRKFHTPYSLWHWKILHPLLFHTPYSPQKGKCSDPLIYSGLFSDLLNFSLKISHSSKKHSNRVFGLKKDRPLRSESLPGLEKFNPIESAQSFHKQLITF